MMLRERSQRPEPYFGEPSPMMAAVLKVRSVRRRRSLVRAFLIAQLILLTCSPRLMAGDIPASPIDRPGDTAGAYRLYDDGRLGEAEAAFQAIITGDPANLDAHEGLTWTYFKQGEIEKAAGAADARLALAPGDFQWRERRIEILHQLPARREEAIAAALALARERPGDLQAQLFLARILSWTQSRTQETVAAYRAAVALNPGSREARRGLARSLWLAGEQAEAKKRFGALIAEDDQDSQTFYEWAEIARWAGDFETADRLLRRGAAADPDNAQIRARLDEVEAQARRLTAARRGVSLPMILALVSFCVLLGTLCRRVTPGTYATLALFSLCLVCLALFWLYRFPSQ